MIYFAMRPDAFFTLAVNEALAVAASLLQDAVRFKKADWVCDFPETARCFDPETARSALTKLIEASRSPEVWRVSEYYWPLIYDALWNYSTSFNDLEERDREAFLSSRRVFTRIRQIDFDGILELFFWDLDFLIPREEIEALPGETKRDMGMHEGVFGIAEGLPPHADDLRLERVSEEEVAERWDDDSVLVTSDSVVYPDDVER